MALEVAKRSLAIKDADASPVRRGKASSNKKKSAQTTTKNNASTSISKSPKRKKVATKTSRAKATTKQTKTSRVKAKATRTKTKRAAASTKTRKTNNKLDQAVKAASKDLTTTYPSRPDQKTGTIPLTRRDRLGHLLLEQLLREAGFRGEVTTDRATLAEYSTDESIFSIMPQLVLKPHSARDVEVAVAVVGRETKRFKSLSLTPRGAGTGLSGGSLTDSVVVDTQQSLTNIGELQYRAKSNEVTVNVEPGVPWRKLEQVLRARGYHIPTYSSSKEICGVGGAVGNNAAGAQAERYGHCVDWVESLEVVLHDGKTYTIAPLTYKEFKTASKKDTAYGRILTELFALLEKHEKAIKKAQPKSKKNTAGYDLWDVLPQGAAAFKKGKGTIDLRRIIAGSQGTIGIITNITFRAIPIPEATTLVCVPIFDLAELPAVIAAAETYNPLELEVFDDRTYDLALQNPDYFKQHTYGLNYYRMMLLLYTTYHVRFARQLPQLMLLIKLDHETTLKTPASTIAEKVSTKKNVARVVYNPLEEQLLWHIRYASYELSKRQDITKRPAAFLEDMTVPTKQLPAYLTEMQRLFKEFNIQATIHGHAGSGHLHFYPLLDFTQKTTAALIEKMSEQFFALAIKHGGALSGEHNDGIIRTPQLPKLYSSAVVKLFTELEHIFDPDDIFNPGKKVNPRFVVRDVIRTSN